MNKKLNKLVTNYPVNLTEEEIENLSATLAPVVAACGGGGGGTGGKIYTGTGYVNVNNTTNQIGLTNEANEKLNEDYVTYVEYSTQIEKFYNKNQVNALLDEKQNELVFEGYDDKIETINGSGFIVNGYVSKDTYQIDKNNFNKKINYLSASVSGKEDKLTFEYDEDNKVSAINGSALAGQGGTTYTPGQYINIDSNNEISVTGVVAADEYATYSGEWNDVSNSYKTNSGSFLTNEDLTNYYKKTQTSSDSELAEAFGSILKYNVTAAAGIEVTTATDAGVKTYGISMTAQPVVTDTRLSGYNGIAAEPDGNVSGLWDVGLTQDMLNTINGKLDSTEAAQTYLEKATYASDSATFALKTQLDDYYKKTDTSSKTELSTEFAKYQVTGDYVTESEISDMATKTWVGEQGFYTKASGDNDYAPKSVTATINTLTGASAGWNDVTAKLDKSIYSNASGNWEASYNVLTAYSAAGTWLTAHQPLTNYYTKSDTSSKLELSDEFAKYVTSSNVTTQDTDYVMTTTGWKVLTLPGGGMTQVIHDETLTGQGNDANSKLGVAWSALSGNTINSALSAGSATSALSAKDALSSRYAKQLQDASKIIEISAITALQNWASSNSSTWDEVSAKLGTAQYANDSATFVTSSNSTITGTKQYALTTAGWTEVQVGASLTASSGININNNLINVTLGRNLKFDTYSSVTTEDDISATSYRAGAIDNQYTIVNKYGLETYFSSAPDSAKLTLTTNGLYNSLVGGNRSITADYNLNHLFFKSYDNIGTYSGDYSQVEIKVLQETAPEATQHRSSITLTDYYEGVEHTGLITVEKIAQWDQGGSFTGVTTAGSISGDGLTNPLGLVTSAEQALTSVSSKVDKPTSIIDKYLVLRTDSNGDVSGWSDLKEQCYSKTEATGTFVATANIDTTTLSGDGKTVSTKLGVKTDVIATKDYVNSSFLPTSGGTVSGQLEVHGGSNFDTQFIKLTREGNSCGARIGLGSDTTNGTLALKTFNSQGQNTVQVNIKHNTNNNELIQVQKGGTDVGFLIPAVTATTTAGITDDGILHIIIES